MIVLHVEVDPGFRKADINSIPIVTSEAIFRFANKSKKPKDNEAPDADLRVDYVQVRKTADVSEARAFVFPAAATASFAGAGNEFQLVRVSIKMDTKNYQILEATCEQCTRKDNTDDSCSHILAFIFWLHRKSTDTEAPAIGDFWGSESEALAEDDSAEAMRIRDIFACDELRLDGDMVAAGVSETQGNAFLDAVLNEMENIGLRDSTLYQHCRPVFNEFEPLFIHHTLLDTVNNGVKDWRTLTQHMEDQVRDGLFDRLAEVSKNNYKSQLWLETQYMRLRCSIIQRIAARKDSSDDEHILQLLFCKDREFNTEKRRQLKQHKRFILKQTEKLENKTYQDCGLLLSESYPFICAAPDGITDDHIVEIKAPKTDEEFEKYLEGRETIAPKYMAQIQIQMYMANVTKALYCVLSPTFDANGALHYVWVQADMEFVASLLSAAEDFWRDIVFPRLAKIYLGSQ